jgi:hypothetical protein
MLYPPLPNKKCVYVSPSSVRVMKSRTYELDGGKRVHIDGDGTWWKTAI